MIQYYRIKSTRKYANIDPNITELKARELRNHLLKKYLIKKRNHDQILPN